MEKIKEYLKLIRVKHYFKNLLVFLPLLCSGELFDKNKLINCILGFCLFSLTASIVYIINDLNDIENDKKHTVKKNRPLASGKVKKEEAYFLAIVLFVIILVINFLLLKGVAIYSLVILLIYLLINVAYSFGLKTKPIVDIVILVSGFFLRVLYGSVITDIRLSNWLYLTIISASFYMGLGKRRNEIIKQGDKSREVLKRYSKDFLDRYMYSYLTLCVVFYSLWCVDSNTISKLGTNVVLTVPLVMIILMKYTLNIEGDSYGDPIDVILSDKILMVLVALYALCMFGIIYFF